MADDIIIKFRADNKQIVQALRELNNLQKKVTKHAQHQTKVFRRLNSELKRTGKVNTTVKNGMMDITNSGRLLNNTFATLRSKLLLVSFAFGIVTAAISKNIEAFGEQEKSVNRLIMSFGTSGRELDTFSSSLQEVTGFADENINVMMSMFGSYGATMEQTKSLTEATINLAAFMDTDLKSAGLLVAKSFGSSTNALSRYGIEIDSSASQQEKIIQIADQLDSKFGGLARGMMQGAQGPLKVASNSFGDLRESMGKALALGFGPIIEAIDRFNKALHGAPIRIFTELVIGLTIAFLGYHAITKSIKGATAIAAAVQGAYAAALTGTAAAGAAATFSLKAFMVTATATTGGLAAIIFVIGGAIAALLEWSGIMSTTADETKEADEFLAKYQKSIKNFGTGDAEEELEKFYTKLKEGNELLSLQVQMLGTDFNEMILGLEWPTIEALTEEEESLANQFVITTTAVWMQGLALKDLEDAGKGLTAEAKEMRAEIERMNGELEDPVMIEAKDKWASLKNEFGSVEKAAEALQAQIDAMNEQFKEQTGMSDEFFEQFMEGSGIMEAVQTGLIANNQELLAVLQENVTLKGALAEADDAEIQAIIAAIVTRERYIATLNKERDTAKKNKAFKDLDWKTQLTQLGQLTAAVGAVFSADKDGKLKGAYIARAAAIIDTAAGVAKASGNWVKQATIAAKGAAQIVKINQQIEAIKSESSAEGKAAVGGYIGGRPHSQGGTLIEAEKGEFIMRKDAVDSIGLETLFALNEGEGAGVGGNVTINVSGNVLTQDYVEGELADSIKEAIRRGSEFGVS